MTQSTDEFRRETRVAIDAVTRALAIARRGIGAGDITAKGGRDLVTVTDVAVKDAVRGIAADALGFSVIGEERGGEASVSRSGAEAQRHDLTSDVLTSCCCLRT